MMTPFMSDRATLRKHYNSLLFQDNLCRPNFGSYIDKGDRKFWKSLSLTNNVITAQKTKFPIKNIFSK